MTCNLAQLLRQGRDPDACANINLVSELGGVPRVEDLDNGEAGKKEANENGSLMFLVSRVKVKNERNIARLGAAGYRSTDLRQVSGHITASLRIGLQLGCSRAPGGQGTKFLTIPRCPFFLLCAYTSTPEPVDAGRNPDIGAGDSQCARGAGPRHPQVEPGIRRVRTRRPKWISCTGWRP